MPRTKNPASKRKRKRGGSDGGDAVEGRSAEEMVQREEERDERDGEEAQRDESERVMDEGEARGEEGDSTEGSQGDGEGDGDEDREFAGVRRRAGAPPLSNEDEMEMVEFVKANTVLCTKEHVHFIDKTLNYRLWEEIGDRVGRSGQMSNVGSRVNAPGTARSLPPRRSQTRTSR